MIGGPGCGNANSLPNIIRSHPETNEIYLYVKHPYEAKILIIN